MYNSRDDLRAAGLNARKLAEAEFSRDIVSCKIIDILVKNAKANEG